MNSLSPKKEAKKAAMNPGATAHLLTSLLEANRIYQDCRSKLGPAKQLKIVILRNYSAEYLAPFLRAYHARDGVAAQVELGNYDAIHQDLASGNQIADANVIVISLTIDALRPDWLRTKFSGVELARQVIGLTQLALQKASCPIIINTFIRPIHNSAGLTASLHEDAADSQIIEANARLRHFAQEHAGQVVLVDWERLVMMLGARQSFEDRMAYVAAAPFTYAFLGAYAYEISKVGRALSGGTKKCLILDCDNTLWGGVVGEAGVNGISLDRNSYPGKAFYDFQKSILRLVDRGVMVALCSKNNPEDALAVLDAHPHCLLKREHLVAWRINWEPKEKNIQELIADLNINMDSVVFVDDSGIECERVAGFLPQITVRQVPAMLWQLPTLLDSEGLFDGLSMPTAEDRKRVKMYQADTMRRENSASYASADDFLASLNLQARIGEVQAAQIPRVAQLTQKTNQFNLTTRRYSEAEIGAMAASTDQAVFTMTPADKFGDLGLSAVLIAHRTPEGGGHIDNFLLSCRILGRRLEDEFVATCLEILAARWNVTRWSAEYIPTNKNRQVEDFWLRFGFACEEKADQSRVYAASVGSLKLKHIPYISRILDEETA